MHYCLGRDHIEIRDLVRRVATERVAPRADEIDRLAEYPEDMFQLLRELGLFALPFPERYGGAESCLSACVAVEELARVCYNTAYLLVIQWTSFGAILAAGTDDQKSRLLPGLASGEIRASIAVTEPQSGSDVSGIRTRAQRTPTGYVIDGAKAWCTGASVADHIVVAAKTPDAGRAGIGLFMVERGSQGLVVGRPEDKMGGRGVPSCEVFFNAVAVPDAGRLGEETDGFAAVMQAFNVSRPVIAARAVGLAQGAMELAIDLTRNRRTFGHAVSDNQGVRWMLADMAMEIEAARLLTYRAASMVDEGLRGRELAATAAMAKCFATDTAMKVSTDAVQLFGAAGVSLESSINRYMRDAKLLQIVEGTNQIQRNLIGKSLVEGWARA